MSVSQDVLKILFILSIDDDFSFYFHVFLPS